MLWEIVLDQRLEEDVVESALKRLRRCLFKIKQPAIILERWT